jgi:signal transduction histidine kinase
LNNLVNDFLLFARPKEANIQEFDLNQLINDSLELFKKSGKWDDKIRLETKLADGIKLKSDPEQIKQVLWNLFLNATEAMSQEGLLRISTEMVNGEQFNRGAQRMAKIVIQDTGLGFSKKALSHLFTPFFTTKEGGSGLGLAMVKRIVEGLRGKVYGKNHPDGGAEITIFLHPSPSDLSSPVLSG